MRHSASSTGVSSMSLQPRGYQRIPTSGSGIDAAVALTVPTDSLVAMVQAETVSVRWRDDGTAPTAGVGNLIPANETLILDTSTDLSALKVIGVAAGAVVNVNYYG